jgi:phage head maturation protease
MWSAWHRSEFAEFGTGSYALLFQRGAFRRLDGQTCPLLIGHAARTGLLCRLYDTVQGLQVCFEIDPLERVEGRLATDLRAGRIAAFSPKCRFAEYTVRPSAGSDNTLVVCSLVSEIDEVTLVRVPARPRFDEATLTFQEVTHDDYVRRVR